MANMMVQNSSPYLTPLISYIRFRKHLQFIFPMLTVQIDLPVAATL